MKIIRFVLFVAIVVLLLANYGQQAQQYVNRCLSEIQPFLDRRITIDVQFSRIEPATPTTGKHGDD